MHEQKGQDPRLRVIEAETQTAKISAGKDVTNSQSTIHLNHKILRFPH